MTRAVGGAKNGPVVLDAVPNHANPTSLTGGGKGMDRTFEAVEHVLGAVHRDSYGFVVGVAAHFTFGHG